MTEYIYKFFESFWLLTCQMAPYLLFGFLLAGILSVLISPEYVEKHFGRKGFFSILKGALLGIPLPICSCGVIPLTTSLKKHGASKGATVSFLTSTPQTGIDSIFVTYSLLGPIFAIFRPLAALVSGIFTGIAVETLSDGNKESSELNTVDSCCNKSSHSKQQKNIIIHILKYGFITLLRDIASGLLIGLTLAAFISVLIPDNWFAGTFGTGFLSMITVMILGIPLYICSTASVPMALAMMLKGLSPGAALVFLVTGTATNAISVATIWRIIGKKSTIVYLGSIIISSIALGYLLNAIYAFVPPATTQIHQHETASLFSQICGFILILLMGYHLLKNSITKRITQSKDSHSMVSVKFQISGLSCKNCLNKAKDALQKLEFVDSVSIELKSGNSFLSIKPEAKLDKALIKKTIHNLGYKTNNL